LGDRRAAEAIAGLILRENEGAGGILEIGPGLGALTRPLLRSGARVTAVELDRGLAARLSLWEECRSGALRVVEGDALKLGRDSFPEALSLVCGNLPYNISSPLLFWFLENFPRLPGVFTLQKELSERLAAPPGTKAYGRLAVGLAPFYAVKILKELHPQCFRPRPRVRSAVALFKPRIDPPGVSPDELSRVSRAAFARRRKTLSNNLGPVYGRERILEILRGLGVDPSERPERLAPEIFVSLALALRPDGA
jgi:16S rRNA (adenine1518-N6/adenine1519-N6)-dimethyltransferase